MRYTDVDRLILERWTEVVALREAFDDLVERMRDSVEAGIVKAVRWASEQGYLTTQDVRRPSLDVWKPDWANKRGEPAVHLRVADFAPFEYGGVEADHPWVWLVTEDLSRFKVSEADRVKLARDLRRVLDPDVFKRWDDRETVEATEPLGRYCTEIDDAQRVRWMSSPDELTAFLIASVQDGMTLAPALDPLVAKLRR